MNSSPIRLDQTDKKILVILQKQAKITNAQLSKDIDLSPAPTLERVKKLENSGIIESYHAKLNAHLLGLGITAFIKVKVKSRSKKHTIAFMDKVNAIDEITECHSVTGDCDYLMRVISRDFASYEALLRDKIGAIDEIADLQSLMILSTAKDTKVMPIP
jgi:DNA-binding Lrp family transcriptional regulator